MCASCAGKRVAPSFDLAHPQEALRKAIDGSCLSGEGKGTLELSQRKNSFSFESRAEKEYWLLGISLPLIGEEVIKLQYRPFVISGGAYQILQQQLLKKKLSPKILDYQFHALANAIEKWQQIKEGPNKCSATSKSGRILGNCREISYSLDEQNLYVTFIEKQQTLNATFSAYNGRYFEMLEIDIPNASKMLLKLKYNQCDSAVH